MRSNPRHENDAVTASMSIGCFRLGVNSRVIRAVLSLGVLVQLWFMLMGWSVVATARSALTTPRELMERGVQAFQRGDAESALVSWREAARLYEQMNQPTKRSAALTQMAQAYEALGFFSQAVSSNPSTRVGAETS